MKKKRILVLNYEFPPLGGGASPVSYEIAKGLVERGHSVDVITMGYKDLPQYEVKDGIKIYRVKCLRSKKEICYPWEQLTYIISAVLFLKKHMKKNDYDINHTHFIIPTGVVSLWLKKKYGLEYVVTSHGSDVPGYNADRFRFLHKFTKPIIKKICTAAKFVTTPSVFLKDLISQNVDEYEIKVIPNGAKDFKIEGIKKENIIFSSGRLLERKGFQYLIEAFKNLNLLDWKLYILGDGPYRQTLEKIANKNPKIIFTGWLDNQGKEYIDIVNKAKIFSLLSASESQGIVFLEAMSANCAIISSNITACKETVTSNIGFLVNREDVQEIEAKLKVLIEDEDILSKFMINSRQRYKKNYVWDNIILKYEKAFNEIEQL